MFKLDLCIAPRPRKTRIDFKVIRSKAKVAGEECLQISFQITPVGINELYQTSPNYHLLLKKNPY